MCKTKDSEQLSEAQLEDFSARWDKITYHTQGSPFEDLSVNCLAKNTGHRRWSRPSVKAKGDTLARYIYLSFSELLEVEQLDIKSAQHLLEICESTMLFVNESNNLETLKNVNAQATSQRMRILDAYGLYQDYPIALTNLNDELRELCRLEEVNTLIDLLGFIDRLTDKAWLSGSFRNLQNVFAHGDEKGICKYFPYRMSHRGFHLPEALLFCLTRLPPGELQSLFEYHERRKRKNRFGLKTIVLPEVVETRILQEFFLCLHYFGQRQNKLLVKLHDSAYVSRELMFLNDPQTEAIIHWLLHLALGIFRPSAHDHVEAELNSISVDRHSMLHRELKDLLEEA